MGKVKQNRFKRRSAEPTGLLSGKEFEHNLNVADMGDNRSENVTQFDNAALPSTLKGLLEKLNSSNLEERFIGCSTLASLVGQKGCLEHLIRASAVRIIGPLLIDDAQSVRKAAVGALRNISIDGGYDVCEEMVKQDVMTPTISLLQQYLAWNQSNPNPNACAFKKSEEYDVLLEVLHLLCNLCENSETAVKIFDQNSLYHILLLCLREEIFGFDITVTAAQCLQIVTENNSAAAEVLGEESIYNGLHLVMMGSGETPKQLLMKTVVTGIVYNICSEKLRGDSELLNQIITVLSNILQQDSALALRDLILSIEAQEEDKTEVAEEGAASCTACEEGAMDENAETENAGALKENIIAKNKEMGERISNIECVIKSHQIAIEMLTNLCCTDDDDDDEWEDLDGDSSNNNSEEEMEELNVHPSVDMPTLATPADVGRILVSCNIFPKVLSKAQLPEERVHSGLVMQRSTFKLLKSMYNLQSCCLLCLSNLFTGLDVKTIGGASAVHEIWVSLSQLATEKRVIENTHLLEAVTCAMRSIIEKVVTVDTAKLLEVTSSDLQFLFEMGGTCTHSQVRVNTIRIVSTIGIVLAKVAHPLLKDMGNFLYTVVSRDPELFVIAEALDSIFDVFAEDNINTILVEMQLIEKLKVLVPVLKAKVKQQKRSLGEHTAIVNTARTNLVRFINYKENCK